MKQIIFLLSFTLITYVTVGQGLDQRTKNQIKSKFLNAKTFYENKEYNNVLTKIEEIEVITKGKPLVAIQNLKVKAYIGKGEFERAKKELYILEGLNLSDGVIEDIAAYSPKIESGLEAERKRKEKARQEELELKRQEQERLKAEQELNQKKRNIANAIYPTLIEQLKQYNELVEGRPYYSKLRNKLTISDSEKAYFVFFGNKYIIYTIPSETAFDALSNKNIVFNSHNARSFDDNIIAKIPSGRSNYEKYFKKSIFKNTPSIGGFGDDILWNKYYSSKDFSIYYYSYYNTLYCDFDIKDSFQEKYFNPYIETGTITKTVDFDLVIDSLLISNLKKAGFKHKESSNINSPKGLNVNLVSSGNIKMLFPQKNINYKYVSEIKGSSHYPNGGSSYKGKYDYYKPGKSSLHAAYKEYYSSKITKNIFKAIGEPANSYIMDYFTFNLIYEPFSKSKGSGRGSYFTKSGITFINVIKPLIIADKKEYYSNGSLASKGVVLKGKKNGLWEFYNENGSLKKKIKYYSHKGDYPEYIYKYNNNILISIERYDQYGKQNFEQYYFYPEKSILQVAYFSDDIISSDELYRAVNCNPDDSDGSGEFIQYREYDDNGELISNTNIIELGPTGDTNDPLKNSELIPDNPSAGISGSWVRDDGASYLKLSGSSAYLCNGSNGKEFSGTYDATAGKATLVEGTTKLSFYITLDGDDKILIEQYSSGNHVGSQYYYKSNKYPCR